MILMLDKKSIRLMIWRHWMQFKNYCLLSLPLKIHLQKNWNCHLIDFWIVRTLSKLDCFSLLFALKKLKFFTHVSNVCALPLPTKLPLPLNFWWHYYYQSQLRKHCRCHWYCRCHQYWLFDSDIAIDNAI